MAAHASFRMRNAVMAAVLLVVGRGTRFYPADCSRFQRIPLIPGCVDWWLCSVRGGRISDCVSGALPRPPAPPAFFFVALAHVLWGLLRIGQGHVAFIATICCI